MDIQNYLDSLNSSGKHHLILVVAPKGEFPTDIIDQKYLMFEKSILKNPKSYIGLYENELDEIMQFTAFRIFLKDEVTDHYNLPYSTVEGKKRATSEEVLNFFVVKEFYNHVPHGNKSEEDAITEGTESGREFLKKYNNDEYEYVITSLGKHSNAANVLLDINFSSNEAYHFDKVYIY
ncbi:hypothetical protein [Paenibacillus sp. FSL R5-0519]|uniref:hypothetical protein n=1 Tax=Paenibacillus sp. FSL R5-0519 TaxID=2921648 RepID=UPI0030DC7316